MHEPTEEELATAGRLAKEAGTWAAVLPFPDADACVIVRAMRQDEFASFYDESLRDGGDANFNALETYTLWPSPSERARLLANAPALPRLVTKELMEMAGHIGNGLDAAIVERLDKAPPIVAERIGLPPDVLSDLLLQYPKARELWVVRIPKIGFACVMRRQQAGAFDTTTSRVQAAIEAQWKGFWAAAYQATIDSVVWASAPIAESIAQYPALPSSTLYHVVRRIGGDGARCERKRI